MSRKEHVLKQTTHTRYTNIRNDSQVTDSVQDLEPDTNVLNSLWCGSSVHADEFAGI